MNGKNIANQVQKLRLVYSVDQVAKGGVIKVFDSNPVQLLREYPYEGLLAAMSPETLSTREGQAMATAIPRWRFRSTN